MSELRPPRPRRAPDGPLRAGVVAAGCVLRGLPLFVRAAPKTPLRALGIVALDALHVRRTAQPLPPATVRGLAMALDFMACANAAWDRKALCPAEYATSRRRLDEAGLGPCVEAYLGRLRELESRRPAIGGDRRRFDDVRAYREAVARLCVATAAAIALDACVQHGSLDDAIDATRDDGDVDTLVRILLQCQIIDDVLDYAHDRRAGLPSFLTASASLPQALAWTGIAARTYGTCGAEATRGGMWPLRLSLSLFTVVTRLVVRLARWRHRHDRPSPTPHSNLEDMCRSVGTGPGSR